jgi:hypothetical protein
VSSRVCSRTACKQSPVYTLTYVYRDSTAVLGPLAAFGEPHSYDLCAMHAARLTVPRGWDVVRLPLDPSREGADDLEALANVVREAGRGAPAGGRAAPAPAMGPGGPAMGPAGPARGTTGRPGPDGRQAPPGRPAPDAEPVGQGVETVRRGHLRVLRSAPADPTR